MLEKLLALNDISGYETRFDTPPPLHLAYIPSLAFSVPEKRGRRSAEEGKARLQMASLTEQAAFPSRPKSSQDLRPFEQPKPSASKSSRVDHWMNELLKRKK